MINTEKIRKKTAKILVFFLVLAFLIPVNAMAAEVLWDSYEIPSTRQKERLLDNADLLSDSEEKYILQQLDSYSEKWKCNLAILTVDAHNGPIQDYADDYFDYNGFQADYNNRGILFMLSMEDREWAISTSANIAAAFTDYGQEYMMDRMLPYLLDGDYNGAFEEYIRVCDYFLDLYSQGTPYDVGYKAPRTTGDIVRYALISILIGLIVAIFPILGMKSQLKTVKVATGAADYESGKGINLRVKEDRFVNKALNRVKIQSESSRSGGSSGGSSMHTSSSGSSHGGSHGHF